jgi:hypothetical protein
MIPFLEADHAGRNPPSAPMIAEKIKPQMIALGPT